MWNSVTSRDVLNYVERNQSIYRNILDNVYDENRHHQHVNHSTRAMYRTMINAMAQTERQMVTEYMNRPRNRPRSWATPLNIPVPRVSMDISGNVTFSTWSNQDNENTDVSGVPQSVTMCPITHQHFTIGDRIARINQCGHIFSEEAFRTWISNHNSCPVCRGTVDPTYDPLEIIGHNLSQMFTTNA